MYILSTLFVVVCASRDFNMFKENSLPIFYFSTKKKCRNLLRQNV